MSKKLLVVLACVIAAAAFAASAALAQSGSAAGRDDGEASSRVLAQVMSSFGGNFLGVHTEDVTRDNMGRFNVSGEPRGVGVSEVVEGSPAAKAGLQKGDVIVRFDSETVTSAAKLQRLISEAAPEQAVQLGVLRGGSERSFSVKLGRRESATRGFRLQDGELFRLDGDAWKRQAEEWKRFGDEWRRQGREWERRGEDWKRQSEEFRRQLENMPRGNYAFALGAGRRIGVASTPLTEQLADHFGVSERRGLLVTSVAADSPAAKAGLKAGDVITEADGEKVGSGGELSRVINRKQEGDVTLTVVRDRNRRTLRVTPEKSNRTTFFDVPEGAFDALEHFDLPDVRVITPTFDLPSASTIIPRVITPRIVMPRIVMPRVVTPRVLVPRVVTPRLISTPRVRTIIL